MLKLLVIAGLFAAATHTFQSQTPTETVAQLQKGRSEMQKTVDAAVPHVQAVMDKVIMPAVNDFKSSSVAVLQTPSVVAVATPTKVATVKQVEAYDWRDHSSAKNCITKANGNIECKQ